MNRLKTLGAVSGLILSSVNAFASSGLDVEANKILVKSFYDLAFNQHKPTEAVRRFIGSTYTQHNPFVPDGGEVFAKYFEGYFVTHPKASSEIKKVIAEGDLVVLHVHSKKDSDDRGTAIVDIFRVENGKIVEHWDVIQEIPENSANSNTMF